MLDGSRPCGPMPDHPTNEPVLSYAKGSWERKALKEELNLQMGTVTDIPCIIAGKEVRTGNIVKQVIPHDHGHVLAHVHLAGKKEIAQACEAAVKAQENWIDIGLEERLSLIHI